jgi:hypothetical protein
MRRSRDGSRRRRTPVDYGKGRPRSLTAPRPGLPSFQGRVLLVALGVHAAVLVFIVAANYLRQLPSTGGTTEESTLTVTWVTADATVTPGAAPDDAPERRPEVTPTPAPKAPFAPSPGMRPFDTSRIRARPDDLFPFLTSRLAVLRALRRPAVKEARSGPVLSSERVALDVLPPLILTRQALDTLVDAAWSRRERWRNFQDIARAADRHHADEGQLPALVRAHVERNLLQPYHGALTPDARFWVILGMAADHRDVVDFVGRYAGRHPSSRTTTELLFLLDELAEAGHDAFNVLRLTELDELVETARLSPNDLTLAQHLQAGWDRWARARGISSPVALDYRTETIRLSILTAIVETSPGGYGAADAQFLAGRLLWARHDTAAAVGWWRAMRSDSRDGFVDVRRAIAGALRDDGTFDSARIDAALTAEQRRWLATATARLAHFGYTPQTF